MATVDLQRRTISRSTANQQLDEKSKQNIIKKSTSNQNTYLKFQKPLGQKYR